MIVSMGILFSIVVLGTACAHPWYLVESRFIDSTREENPPEVTGTSQYYKKHRRSLRVALRAPDTCANRSSAQTSGMANAAGALIGTDCGVEMAEMERALAKAGYTVSSWNAVSSIVKFEGVTPINAAKKLGAQILFQVNSLERTTSEPGRDLRMERSFFMSNPKGEKGEEAFVEEQRATTLEDMMAAIERDNLPNGRMSATVNVSAVDVETGQSIWFYEWTVVEDRELESNAAQLFLCHRSNQTRCFMRAPQVEKGARSTSTRSGGVRAESVGAGAESERTAMYHRLVREVVADLVQRFADESA